MGTRQVSIYYIDNDYKELDFFRDKFKPEISFDLFTFSSPEMLFNKLKSHSKEKAIKVVITDYLIKSRGAHTSTAIDILPKIKNIDENIEVIILADSDNIELKATGGKIKPIAYIKKDSQYFIRLEAVISRLISEYNMTLRYRQSKLAALLFASLIFIGILFFLYFFFFYKEML